MKTLNNKIDKALYRKGLKIRINDLDTRQNQLCKEDCLYSSRQCSDRQSAYSKRKWQTALVLNETFDKHKVFEFFFCAFHSVYNYM